MRSLGRNIYSRNESESSKMPSTAIFVLLKRAVDLFQTIKYDKSKQRTTSADRYFSLMCIIS